MGLVWTVFTLRSHRRVACRGLNAIAVSKGHDCCLVSSLPRVQLSVVDTCYQGIYGHALQTCSTKLVHRRPETRRPPTTSTSSARPPLAEDMVGRRATHDDGHALAIQTDCRGKAPAGHDRSSEKARALYRTGSVSSEGDEEDDHHMHTHLSASSAGNTDMSSSSAMSQNSTAPTSTMTDDDRPSVASPTSPSPYAHPALTVLELVSNTASSSALPDQFDFNVSRKGNFVAVYSSSNIWLVKTTQLPRLWARTLQVKRKPVAIDVTEDGFLLAVLSRPSQVDLYEIHGEQDRQIKKRRTISLVHEAETVAISPDSLIIITGNKFGIEVVAIGPEAPETARRTLTGQPGDILQFSDDGRTLLITSYARKSLSSSLYVLPGLFDGPLNEEGVPVPEAPDTLWTGSMLFPETAKIARQATLLPDADTGHVSELFAFNSQEDTWGVYDIATQRFTQRKMFLPDQQRWTRSEFVDDAMPAVSPSADLAAVSLRMRGTTSIWIYQVPEWDFQSTTKSDLSPIQPCFCIPILSDGPNTYQEICALRWVTISSKVQRLIAVGNSSTVRTDEVSGGPSGSKGVVIVLDFDKSKPAGSPTPRPTKTEYDLDPLCPGEMLPEGSIDFEREVELVRTRTLAQRRAQDGNGNARRNSRIGSTPIRARTSANRERPSSIRRPTDEDELTLEEAQAAFEMPYDNQQPRSQMSLARAATVAAVSPANRRHLRALPFRPLEYRRADGMREMPHESDADNWVPPPPAYTATAEASQSVSLSHPNGAPVSDTQRNLPDTSIPPIPALPANLAQFMPPMPPTHPYQSRGGPLQSQSSTDLPSTRAISPTFITPPQQRRPSLMHPTTFPSPDSLAQGRRRSSTATSRSSTHPVPRVPSHHQSAYRATASRHDAAAGTRPSTRPPLTARNNPNTAYDLRPPPVIDPHTGRRGSAPDVGAPHRTRPAASPNRISMPVQPTTTRSNTRRHLLPRLTTRSDAMPAPSAATRQPPIGPLSAPPPGAAQRHAQFPNASTNMSGGGSVRAQSRVALRTDGVDRERGSPKRKIGCVVM